MQLLQWYIVSIMIYFVVHMVLLELCSEKIYTNGWLDNYDLDINCCDYDDDDDDENPYLTLLIICAVPIFRLLQCITIIAMTTITKEEYEKLKDEDED